MGDYLVICRDAAGHQLEPHTAQGMIKQLCSGVRGNVEDGSVGYFEQQKDFFCLQLFGWRRNIGFWHAKRSTGF